MGDEPLNSQVYWHILRKSWWILVLGVMEAFLGAYFVGKSTTPIYEAQSRILVQVGQNPGSPSLS